MLRVIRDEARERGNLSGKEAIELRDHAQKLVAFLFGHGVLLAAEDNRRAHAVVQLVVVD